MIKIGDIGRYTKPYIYTNGKQPWENGFKWHIDHFKTEEEAMTATPSGWTCNRYVTTKQYTGDI